MSTASSIRESSQHHRLQAIFLKVTNDFTIGALTQNQGAGNSVQLGEDLALSLDSCLQPPKASCLLPSQLTSVFLSLILLLLAPVQTWFPSRPWSPRISVSSHSLEFLPWSRWSFPPHLPLSVSPTSAKKAQIAQSGFSLSPVPWLEPAGYPKPSS